MAARLRFRFHSRDYIGFTREEVEVIFQSLCLAEMYYNDEGRQVKGMHQPSVATVAMRKKVLAPVIEKITRYANGAR